MLHINKAIVKHNNTVLDRVTASARLKCKNAVTLGLIQPLGVAKGSLHLSDSLQQMVRSCFCSSTVECLMHFVGGCQSAAMIDVETAADGAPHRRMLLADDRAEPAVLRFVQVVSFFFLVILQ